MARSGNNHKGGRPTKAEEFGLNKKLNEAFKRMTKGKFELGEEADQAILQLMWEKANAGEYKAIEWIAHRFFGKEPKVVEQETTLSGINVKELLNYKENKPNE